MTILVTGGAGLIGSNIVRDWLAQSGESIVNVDKFTHAGKLETLASLNGHPGHIFVQAGIGDRDVFNGLLVTRCPRAVVKFTAESHFGLFDFCQQ